MRLGQLGVLGLQRLLRGDQLTKHFVHFAHHFAPGHRVEGVVVRQMGGADGSRGQAGEVMGFLMHRAHHARVKRAHHVLHAQFVVGHALQRGFQRAGTPWGVAARSSSWWGDDLIAGDLAVFHRGPVVQRCRARLRSAGGSRPSTASAARRR